MKMVLDRFVGNYAVCEDMETRDLIEYPIKSLPEDAAPGDVLIHDGYIIIIDRAETKERRKRIKKMSKDLRA